MGRVAILADDLTGALDTAAPFAIKGDAVTVTWRGSAVAGSGAFAFDTETREANPDDASTRVHSCLPRLRNAEISFKKLDSLMRGNTLAELAVCAGSGAFASVVIAPAFPEQGRITRRGRQIAAGNDDSRGLDVDVAAALAARRIAARIVGRGEAPPDRGVTVCDAETGADLAKLAETMSHLQRPLLWCGTAGLARALSHPVTVPAQDLAGRRLVILGTRHPVAVAQAQKLRARMGRAAALVEAAGDTAAAIRSIRETLGAGGSSAILFALPPLDPPSAEAIFDRAFADLARIDPPEVLVVVGGDTLFRLCRAIGAESLAAIGEWSPGVPVSRIAGGPWGGTTLISKSGAFGDADLLVRILDNAEVDARG